MLKFQKLQGSGNDFIVVDNRAGLDVDWRAAAIAFCDRHFGVGADGILLVENPVDEGYDLRMRLINADGGEAEMCGNGIRCTARFALSTGITGSLRLGWQTGAGLVVTEVIEHGPGITQVRVDMGAPRFTPAEVPVEAGGTQVVEEPFDVLGERLDLTCVSMGNPHAVAFVDDVREFPLARFGPAVETNPRFPRRTNFEVVQVISPSSLRMRVWERGVGETLACGTGACAAAVASQLGRGTDHRVDVAVPGGHLEVEWRPGESVLLTGPAQTVFVGELPDVLQAGRR